MHRSLLLGLGFALASASAVAQVTTNAAFTRYFGDVTPPNLSVETDINGVAVTPFDPPGGVALDNVAAVPEPSEWMLMLAGLAGMATVTRSRLRGRG